MNRKCFALATVLIFIFYISQLVGCANRPIANGSHIDLPYAQDKVAVWGTHTGAVSTVTTELQKGNLKIVERSRLKQIFDEQNIILSDTTDDESQVLKAGKLAGADYIVFVDVQTSSNVVSSAVAYKYTASSSSGTVYHLSVSVRGVSVETGEVLWTGSAHYQRPINNPEAGIIYASRSAIIRALCPSIAWSDNSGCDIIKAYGTGRLGYNVARNKTKSGFSLIVITVDKGLPADKAGLKVGDILLSCDDREFQNAVQQRTECRTDAGQQMNLKIKRGDKIMNLTATAVPRKMP